MATKRQTLCKKCKGGVMYGDMNEMAKPVWKCANCYDEIPRFFRKSKKQKRLDELFEEFFNET